MKKNFLSINIPKLPVCSTEQGIKIIKDNIEFSAKMEKYLILIPENLQN